ncbi:ATP-binding protein [Streptomyces syringium]|uniref:ATP-binding protein n=1 Tax=Streptomyces syringium TaxID=76729 RepID=UPI00365E98F9
MDEYTSRVRAWGLTCPGSPEEVGRARRWTRDVLGDCPCVDDATLIVSELSTNAVTHTASGNDAGLFHITLALSERVVAISVMDAGNSATGPKVEHARAADTHGRGLALVSVLAENVAVCRNSQGYTVTAELLMPPRAMRGTR